jgi:DNA polymerase-3 subunit alpha
MIRNHLNVRSDFSLGESTLQMSALVKRAKELNYESVTLMDTMSVHGLVDFSVRAEKEGIKPNIGCRLRVVEDPTYRKPAKSTGLAEKPNPLFMPKVYALNEEGVQSIFALLTKSTTA